MNEPAADAARADYIAGRIEADELERRLDVAYGLARAPRITRVREALSGMGGLLPLSPGAHHARELEAFSRGFADTIRAAEGKPPR